MSFSKYPPAKPGALCREPLKAADGYPFRRAMLREVDYSWSPARAVLCRYKTTGHAASAAATLADSRRMLSWPQRQFPELSNFGGLPGKAGGSLATLETAPLAAMGGPTEVPRRSPGRGPPYWKSRVLCREALGDEDDAQSRWVQETA